MSSSSNGAEAKVRAAPRDAAGGWRAAGIARAHTRARAGGDDAGAAASSGGRARSQETDEGEERSILKLPSESRIRAPSTGGKSLSWNDEVGGGLIEVHYAEELHYSPHSKDREVARRQQLRQGQGTADGEELSAGGNRRCCAIS